jgi:PPP family 3-phenylpropionic acid transporter
MWAHIAYPGAMSMQRLRLLYLLAFGALGALMPYVGLELQQLGLSGTEIGVVLLGFPLGRVFACTIWAWIADRYRIAGRLLSVSTVLSIGGALLLIRADGVPSALLGLSIFALGRSPQGPLLDGLAMVALGKDRAGYGRIRLWGSVGFLVCTLLAGFLHDRFALSPLVFGTGVMVIFALGALLLEDDRAAVPPADLLPALREVLKRPGTGGFLLAAALHLAAQGGYDLFLAVHVHALGYTTSVASMALAMGVAVEIVVLWYMPKILPRVGEGNVVIVAMAVGAFRWWALARITSRVWLILLQGLHGLTYGAYWAAAVSWLAERTPDHIATSAQSLFYAAGWGVGGAVGAMVAGTLLEQIGSAAMYDRLTWFSLVAAGIATLSFRRDASASRVGT